MDKCLADINNSTLNPKLKTSEFHFLLNCDLYRLECAELMRKLAKNILDISVLSEAIR